LGKDEVTQAQWEAVMGENPSKFNQPDNPVVRVSWEDIQTFLMKLNQNDGRERLKFRLPTEAQWEYACRAGSTTAYCFGESERMLKEFGWWWSGGRYGLKTHRVGQLKPNAWGLRDMHGNVWEWCADWFGKSYYTQSPTNDPNGPSTGAERVFRGGCYLYHPALCRSAYRGNKSPGSRGGHIGFRVAAVLPVAEITNANGPESKASAIPAIPAEQVEVVADAAAVKIRDEVIASVSKGATYDVVRRDGSWVAIDVGTGTQERIGWVWARQVQTVVPSEITEGSSAPDAPNFLQVSVDSTQLTDPRSSSVHALYCHVLIDNRDTSAVRYDATEFSLEVDGQAVKHVASKNQDYSEMIFSGKDATRARMPGQLKYLEAGQIPPGGGVDGWLRFDLPAFTQASELAKKTWTLKAKVGDRTFNVDLRQAEFDALAAVVRPAAVDDSVSAVEIGGSRLNGLNVGKFLELISPLVAKGQGFVIVMTDEHCIADSFAWKEIRSATSRSSEMVAWAKIPRPLQDYVRMYLGMLFHSETEAVMHVLGKRKDSGTSLAAHLDNAESATRVAAARALADHTAETGVVDALVKAANHTDARTRVVAMSSLANSADAKATQAIIKGMSDSETSVRMAAAQAAASHEAQSVVDPLIGLLGDADTNVVIVACASLGTLKSEKAVARIKELQAAEDQRISAVATDALKAIGALSSLEAARVKIGKARLLADEFAALAEAKDKTVVPKLIAELQAKQKTDPSYTNQIVKTLGDIGDTQCVEPLLGLLRHSSGSYSELPLALGKLGDKRAIKPIEEMLASQRTSQRCPYYGALLMLGVPGMFERISEEVSKKPENHQMSDVTQLLDVLASCGDPKVVVLIQPLLDSSRHHRSAASSLLKVGTREALDAGKSRLLNEEYPHAQTVIIQFGEASRSAGQQPLAAEPATSEQFRDELQRTASLAAFFKDVMSSGNESVRSSASVYYRQTAAGIQQSLAESGVVDSLVKAASDQDAATRWAAVSLLAQSKAPQTTQAILTALTDADARVRTAAASAAARHQGEATINSLVKLLGDPDANVVVAACGSLGMLRAETAVDSIRELQSSEDTRLAAAAINALKTIGTLTTLEAARAKLGMARLSADELHALAWTRDRTVVPKLIVEMQANQTTSRSYTDQIVKALGDIGDPKAVEPLLELLNQRTNSRTDANSFLPQYGPELPTALGKLGDKRAIKPLEEALARAANRRRTVPSLAARSQDHSFLVALLRLEAPGIVERIAEEIKGKKGYEVSSLVKMLGHVGGPQTVPLIEPLLDEPQHCRYAAGALVQVGSPEAVEPLRSRLMSKDYAHARAVAPQLANESYSRTSQRETAEQIQERLDRIHSLLEELAESPNSEVQEVVPHCLSAIEHRLASNDLQGFMAHIWAKEFDAADEAFQKVIAKSIAAVDDDPSCARRVQHCLYLMQPAYARAEQTDRAERQFAHVSNAIKAIAEKSDPADLSGLSLDLRGIWATSTLFAKMPVDDKEIRQLLDHLDSFLGERAAEGLTMMDLSVGGSLANALHRTDHVELAIETYQLLASSGGPDSLHDWGSF